MIDELRGPTPPRPRRDNSGPISIQDAPTKRLSPAEVSQVSELLGAALPGLSEKLEQIATVLDALRSPRSSDSVVMSKTKRTTYRGTIGGLLVLLVTAVVWYGDQRETSARAAVAAEAKAAEAERSAVATAKLAEETAERVDRLESKIDLVLAKLEERP